MPASTKTKGRRNREGSATSKRLNLASEEEDDFGSYHSHHRLVDGTVDTSKAPKQLDQHITKDLLGDEITPGSSPLLIRKAVIFSTKVAPRNPLEETPETQSSATQSKSQNETSKTGAKKKPFFVSKLTQTSNCSFDKVVACRSVAVSVPSNVVSLSEKPLVLDHSRPTPKCTRWSPALNRRTYPPGSCMTISSGRYSRTESSIMAALDVPPASHRHARCMAEFSSLSPKSTTSVPIPSPKRNKVTATCATKRTGVRKQRIKRT